MTGFEHGRMGGHALPNDAPLEPTVTGAEALYAVGEGLEAERVGCAYTLGRRAWHGVHTSYQTRLCYALLAWVLL